MIQDELNRIINAKSAIRQSIENKGVSVGNAKLNEFANLIDQISVGGGGSSEGVPSWVFDGNNVSSIVVPEGVLQLRKYCFCNLGISEITLPQSLEIINDSAFRSCSNLQHVTIPQNVYSIGSYAFQSCYNLRTVTFPESVISADYDIFSNCSELQHSVYNSHVFVKSCKYEISEDGVFTVPVTERVISYSFDWDFYGNAPHTCRKIVFSEGIKDIGQIQNQNQCREIEIPTSVEKIQPYFINSGLEKVTIKSTNIDGFDQNAFDWGNDVQNVYVRESILQSFKTKYPNIADRVQALDKDTFIDHIEFEGAENTYTIQSKAKGHIRVYYGSTNLETNEVEYYSAVKSVISNEFGTSDTPREVTATFEFGGCTCEGVVSQLELPSQYFVVKATGDWYQYNDENRFNIQVGYGVEDGSVHTLKIENHTGNDIYINYSTDGEMSPSREVDALQSNVDYTPDYTQDQVVWSIRNSWIGSGFYLQDGNFQTLVLKVTSQGNGTRTLFYIDNYPVIMLY